MYTEFTLMDGRWRERGWLEAFRLRLTGWLPPAHVVTGVDKGVLKWNGDVPAAKVELSVRGANLTHLYPPSKSEDNIQVIANVLWTLGFERSWVEPADRNAAIFIDEKSMFDAPYRERVFSALKDV